ncbi:zonular occludens toxin domain-containing protein [Burkholderia pseudomallei]|uniref:zonular occludens toxin domain-containing protein n=1 Tax=Burkholderia pseudomallei TaxID=28450 RepID=UPI001F608960|nr:zonular occludens toxin domain-containing protein [Burkholderia pseudomallei]
MITLITGVPGSGKTLHAVWLLTKISKGRRVLVDGIRDLAIEHVEIDEPWLRQWHEKAEAHDLIVVDEAQRIYPPTTVSQKPTPDVEQLHVHRHKGVDFILITQHPQRISKTVRDLVGRHIHVRNLFGLKRAMLYEWDHCHNPSSLKDAVKRQWAYPREVFKLYTSAEVHTKKQAVVPKALFDLRFVTVAQIVDLIYQEAMHTPYVLGPVMGDFLDSLGFRARWSFAVGCTKWRTPIRPTRRGASRFGC